MLASRHQAAPEEDTTLTAPVTHQVVDPAQLGVGDVGHTRFEEPLTHRPPAHRRGDTGKRTCVDAPLPPRRALVFAGAIQQVLGELVQRLAVLTQLRRGASERGGNPALQDVLQQRQHFMPQSNPSESRVDVVRIPPCVQSERGAGLFGGDSRETEQWAPPWWIQRSHTGDRPGPGAAAETKQDGFGLVIEGVTE